MTERKQYPYVAVRNLQGQAGLRPLLPITLQNGGQQRESYGLLDTGADVNVLPYELGLDLGCVWEDQLHYEEREALAKSNSQ